MRKRLIPVLLIDNKHRLVKTVNFGKRTYIGDPFNVVRLFNEKEVDELCVLDIDASREGRPPDFGFINELASECFMPLSYGGGISTVTDCETLNRSGVEKFILGKNVFNTDFVRNLCKNFGSQAVVACLDVIGSVENAQCLNNNQLITERLDSLCKKLEDEGVGEIIIQSIDRDGLRAGYDLKLISWLSSAVNVPLVALGGAGNYKDLSEVISVGASAAASGSVFTFVGRLRAVLINYPDLNNRFERVDF